MVEDNSLGEIFSNLSDLYEYVSENEVIANGYPIIFNGNTYKFILYKNVTEVRDLMLRFKNRHRMNLYELVPGGSMQKARFDLELEEKDEYDLTDEEWNEAVIRVINAIRLTLHKWGIKVSNNCRPKEPKEPKEPNTVYLDDILIFDSSGPKGNTYKWSAHIVIDNAYHPNCEMAKYFHDCVCANLDDDIRDAKIVDPSVYKRNQQFRLIYSQKAGSNRPKLPIYEWRYGTTKIKWRYYRENVSRDSDFQTRLLDELESSMLRSFSNRHISYTLLANENFSPDKPLRRLNTSNVLRELPTEVQEEAFKLLCSIYP